MAPQFIYTMRGLKRFYPPDREVLRGINLSFYPGAKIGVIGGNGYYILLANGIVFAYGDAFPRGGPAGVVGFDPASAIFTDTGGGGYWVTTSSGAVYTYGDTPNDGSMAGTSLNGSIIAATGF